MVDGDEAVTLEQQTVWLIKGAISEMSKEQQGAILDAYEGIREIERQYPDVARIAIGLRGAELAAEAE